MNRRDALKTAAGFGAFTFVPASAFGANERVTTGIMGVRGRGRSHVDAFSSLSESQVKYVCDVDANVLGGVVKTAESRQGKAPEAIGDFRRMLDDRDVDAIAIATPDHWHALATILACQAGKDVYVEKPASQTAVEGRRMIEAARRFRRIVQVGTQRRSSPFFQETIKRLREGLIGEIRLAKAVNCQKRSNIGHAKDGQAPAGVDYDLWLGPAPSRPFNANRFHYNWHWFWDYGTGDLGNDGVHHVDVARWGLGAGVPNSVTSGGGKLSFDDDQETPDTQIVTYHFGDRILLYEMRLWSPYGEHGFENGNVFYGEKGYMVLGNAGYQLFGPKDKLVESKTAPREDDKLHQADFIRAIKSREKPNCDVEEGHFSALLCHFGNIAHRVGRVLTINPDESISGDPEASRLLSRDSYRAPWRLPKLG